LSAWNVYPFLKQVKKIEKEEGCEKKEEAYAGCDCSAAQLGVKLSSEKKWLRIWDEIADRILKLPLWMQQIILDDIQVAIENRVSVMERIQKKKAGC
jgi:hypothetical protein